RDLKKSQDILGDLHDRQVLIDELPDAATPEHPDIHADHIKLVNGVLEAESLELHARYVSRRARLLEICERTEQAFANQWVAVGSAVALGAVAVSSALYTWQHVNRTGADEVAISIPIRQAAPTVR